MDWIKLHRKGQVTWVDFAHRMEMYLADGVTVIKAFTPFGDYFDESPDEILAIINWAAIDKLEG